MNYKIECWGKADLERLPKGTHTDECLEGSVLEEQAILKVKYVQKHGCDV